jgi:uncharacterized protein (TIGR02246 family)
MSRAVVVALYTELLSAWNRRDHAAFAALFAEDGTAIGFDGSEMKGREQTSAELGAIFASHPTAAYVAKVSEIRQLDSQTLMLRAKAGMVPPGKTDLMPERNAMQTLVAVVAAGQLKIALFQNTPARFDGRPRLVEEMTAELTTVHRAGQIVDAH